MDSEIIQISAEILKASMEAKIRGIDIFVEYSPHVEGLTITILNKPWNRVDYEQFKDSKMFYLDEEISMNGLKNILNTIKQLGVNNMTDDPIADYDRYSKEQEDKLSSLPVCMECEEPIQQEDVVCLNGKYLCDYCLEDLRIEITQEDMEDE